MSRYAMIAFAAIGLSVLAVIAYIYARLLGLAPPLI